MLVAPSPKNATATRGSPRNLKASAAPTIAGRETLLDLLLETPDQEHLPKELAQRLVRDPATLLDFRHGRDSTLRAMALVEQFRRLESGLPDGWQSARLRLVIPDEGDCARAAALLGPTNPGRRGK